MTTQHTLQDLHDAFAGLERRADLAEMERRVNLVDPTTPPKHRSRGRRSMPVVATVAAVAALIVGVAWVVPNDTAGPPAGTAAAAAPPTTHAELESRFRAVLGDTATFEVEATGKGKVVKPPTGSNAPDGLSIMGPLTARGVTGYFVLDFYPSVSCGDPNISCPASPARPTAQVQEPPEGRSLSITVCTLSDDGHSLLALTVTGVSPHHTGTPDNDPAPLSSDEVTEIVDSPLWW